ncbi:hypothetical protein HanIR_Chr11g0535421 [Helianthus annuus]|nr:hypothetical protein HanIR_Chr11g0535421 [Helianthus annuus]
MYGIYKKKYINILRLGYGKPSALALRASILDLVAFVRLSLFKTKSATDVCRFSLKTADILPLKKQNPPK